MSLRRGLLGTASIPDPGKTGKTRHMGKKIQVNLIIIARNPANVRGAGKKV
jgi:hypothetical protein